MKNRHAVAAHFAGTWDEARVQRWADGVRARLDAGAVSLGVIFMTPDFFDVAAEALEVIWLHARVPLLVGCSSQSLIVNGEERAEFVESGTKLLEALRDKFVDTSPKAGCRQGTCGACSGLIDGELKLSCLMPAETCEGARSETT